MFNAGSLMNKLDEPNSLATLSHIDAIGVTETWLHDELKDHEVNLPGYVLFRHDRPSSKRGGGNALYVKSNLRPNLTTPSYDGRTRLLSHNRHPSLVRLTQPVLMYSPSHPLPSNVTGCFLRKVPSTLYGYPSAIKFPFLHRRQPRR